jgi:glycosyltransferase involved in cell wall biosynthesis
VSWYADHAAARLFELNTPFCRSTLGLHAEQPDTFKHALGLALPTPFALYYYLLSRVAIGRHRPDAAYMNTGIGGYEPAIFAAHQLGVPVVCHLRHSRRLDTDEQRAARRVARFVTCSQWGARHVEKQLGRPATDIDCVYDGIDLSAFDRRARDEEPPALPGGPVYVCLVGSLIARKRPLLAIEALARTRSRAVDLRLVLAGDGPLRADVDQAVQTAGLEPAVLRLGSIGAVPALLRRCHVGLLVSESEGMPNAVMEYMAAGLPVVTSAVPGVDELVDHGRTGIVLPNPTTPDAIAEALLALAESADRRASLGRAGREKIAGEAFGVEAEARAVGDVLVKAVERSRRQPH